MQTSKAKDSSEDDIDKKSELIDLPRRKGWFSSSDLSLHQEFWCPTKFLPCIISFQKHFQAKDNDIILASKPKSGTTWLKALLFSTLNRHKYPILPPSQTHPLLTSNPHQLVPFIELLFAEQDPQKINLIDTTPTPRLFSTHIPFSSLPESTLSSCSCRVVYICRNPLDLLVSHWHFARAQSQIDDKEEGENLEEFVEAFCKGEEELGPFWKHVLEYWEVSLKNPKKVLFLRYEDLKEDPCFQLRRIAEFIGSSFTEEEEKNGVVEEIVKLCSLRNLKNMDVNKNGKFISSIENKSYFRKGEVGDWINCLTPSMAERLNKVIQEKLSGSGLVF